MFRFRVKGSGFREWISGARRRASALPSTLLLYVRVLGFWILHVQAIATSGPRGKGTYCSLRSALAHLGALMARVLTENPVPLVEVCKDSRALNSLKVVTPIISRVITPVINSYYVP